MNNRNTSQHRHRAINTPATAWQELINSEAKKSKAQQTLPAAFLKAQFVSLTSGTLTLYFQSQDELNSAKPSIDRLKALLTRNFSCQHIELITGTPDSALTEASRPMIRTFSSHRTKTKNPLAALCDYSKDEPDLHRASSPKAILNAACTAEEHCSSLYQQLATRTRTLTQPSGTTLTTTFKTDMRVGGTRGFCELLLPVLHPVFGIPYIPAASLKGAARAIAVAQKASQIEDLLGYLSQDGKTAQAAKVEFLDAFPLHPCLSLDIATPQWNWENDRVKYGPAPHPLLVLKEPQFLIGLVPSQRGSSEDVAIVRDWLTQALNEGIGAHISAGYGRAELTSTLYHSATYPFELTTQGIYGATQPDKLNKGIPELRSKAIRGVLRYWFRAIALSLYPANVVRDTLEPLLFGTLTPKSIQGSIRIGLKDVTLVQSGNQTQPYTYKGAIVLESKNQTHLVLAQRILELASLLGGIGRGSRRPLHLLDGRMRGCHWQLKTNQLPLQDDIKAWQKLFREVKDAFNAVRDIPRQSYSSSPGQPGNRLQDVLDKNARILLIPSSDLPTPGTVRQWKNSPHGKALDLLYSDRAFKGEGRRENSGNPLVGGKLGTPSYVYIKSIFPNAGTPYQVVTVFDANGETSGQRDRKAFVKVLKDEGAIQVYPTQT